jgi:hypothetical protein
MSLRHLRRLRLAPGRKGKEKSGEMTLLAACTNWQGRHDFAIEFHNFKRN